MLDKKKAMLIVTVFIISLLRTIESQQDNTGSEQYIPQSDTQNWAAGKKVVATATCGENVSEPELFCKLTGANPDLEGDLSDHQVIQGQYCDNCDPRNPSQSHSAEFVTDGTERWWQSPPLSRGLQYNEVNLTIDLAQELYVGYVYITMGNSPRPRVFALERSKDNGKTWTPWQFFADSESECQHHFGDYEYSENLDADDSVLCTTKFSDVKPLEGGEIYVSLINNRPSAERFQESEVLKEWTKATNIRLRLLRVNTLLGRLMAINQQDVTVTRRYFYSIKGISVGGSCICNGHARECTKPDPKNPLKKLCDCLHNTCGEHCDQCCYPFIQKKWRPAETHSFNECELCQCNNHSDTCYYSEEVAQNKSSYDLKGNLEGGGVCTNCQHNTEGINCHKCRRGYYKRANVPIYARNACAKCNCDTIFSSGACDDETGRCQCKPEFSGPDCRRCNEGYFGYPRCQPCRCHVNGTRDKICDPSGGVCPCKENYDGPNCDQCAQGFYNFPECKPCNCDAIGSNSRRCDLRTGQCICRARYGGRDCGTCAHGYYNYPQCEICNCNTNGATEEVCRKDDGACICKKNFAGERCDRCLAGFYRFPYCISCNCNQKGVVTNECNENGQCNCKPNYVGQACDQCAPGFYKYPECLPCGCHHTGSQGISCDAHTGVCACKNVFEGAKCDSCKPNLFNFPICEECSCNIAGSREVPGFPLGGCGYHGNTGELCLCKERVTGRHCDVCKPTFWKLHVSNPDGCEDCKCDTRGTLGGSNACDSTTGQCKCKPFVTGRKCDQCVDGTFALQDHNPFGCQPCKCDVGGSQSNRCDYAGKCTCKPMIHGTKCDQALTTHYVPNLHQMIYEMEDGRTSDGNNVRFGFDSNEFHGYSWRGYAIFSRIQDEVLLDLDVRKPGLYRVVYHYLNKNNQATTAEVRVSPDQRSHTDGHSQSSFVTFHPLVAPDFATMSSGGGVSSAFTLNPGRWTFSLKTPESVLVDYMVLLPAAYYEAPILHEKFHQPCTVPPTSDICKHYVYLDLKPFSNVPGSSGESGDGSYHEKTQLYDNQSNLDKLGLTDMAKLDERQTSITFTVPVEQPGPHVLIISYFTDDINRAQDMEADIQTPGARDSGFIRLANCPYSSPCRQFISDDSHNVKVINVDGRYFTLTLNGRSDINLAVDKVYAIPLDKWHLDLIEPKFKCIYKKEKCIQGRPAGKPPGVTIEFEIGSELPITPPPIIIEGSHPDPSIKVIKLHRREPRIDIKVQVTPGNYALVPLYYQPHIVGFDVDVEVYAGGQFHKGTMRADPCPSLNGCHGIVKFKNRPNVDIVDSDARVSFNSTNPVWLDYLAVIPSVSYSEKIHADNTEDDKSAEFINKCSDHGFSVDATGLQFCKDSIYSITTDYNNGALKCQCDPDGSTSFNCDPYGGKCPCKSQFIIGRDCSQCKTGYWGFPNCRECQCPTGICEPKTGRCVCPKLVTGENCDTCLPNTFGYNALVGCEECGCDARGVVSADMECDGNSGQCHCKPNVAGRKCNRCKLGYYDFPRCRQCSCDLNGVLSDVCDQQTGRCLCKENVEGHDCSQCQPSTFSLLASNPKGCSQCFCFGVTSRCQASDLRWAQITELQDWTVTNTMATAEYDEDRRMWHLQEVHLQTTDQPAYWSAPMAFLNNKVRSYGGKLRYKLLADGMEAERFKSPDLILVGKSSRVSYVHGLQEVHSSVEHAEEVHLVETKFVHERTGAPISRDQFLILLSNLQSILIMASPFKDTSYIKLSDVSMEEAREDGWGEVADSVERCECPPNHGGSSCESCAQGFFRAKNGQCLACQCNNRATTCDQTTGICINCRDNFDGPHCLKCKRGYFLDRQSNTCRICPCPLRLESNNFATHCDVSFAGVVDRCYCLPGYTGKNCDKCAPGYWGHPMTPGGQCKKCECSGNIDERDPMACDVKTGRCLKCLQNTGGERCERCADGYYGDALDGRNCKKCLCEPLGTDHCDHVTGQCVCKQNVYGPQCSQCVPGSFGFHRNRGCEMCSCGVAATSSECDPLSGQCQCREGVTGRMCDRCIDGFWNYLPQGCRPCNCLSKGAVTCDKETGECQCLPGVTGPNCDKCLHKWIMIEGFGCKECDSCVQLLLDDIDVLHRNVTQMKHDLTSVSVSVQTIHHLETLDRRYHDLEPKVKRLLTDRPSSGHDVIEASREIEEVHSSAKTVLQTLNRLYNESERVEDSARDIKTEVNNYYESIRSKTKDLVDDALNKVRIKTDQLTTSGASSNVDEMVKECTAILTEMRVKDFHDEKDMALNELAKANDTLLRARELLGRSHTRLNRTTDINSSIYLILAQLQDLQRLAQSSAQRSAEVTKLLNELRNTKAHVEGLIIKIKNSEGQITKCLEESRKDLDVVDDDLNEAKKAFNSANSDLERLKTLVADAQRFVNKLVAENENLKTLLGQVSVHVNELERKATSLMESISNTESSVKLAIEASGVYETIVKTIEEAWKDSQEAERLVDVARKMSVILSIDTSEKSAQLGNISKQISLIKMSIERDLVDKLAIIQGMLKSMKESEKDKSYTDVVKGLEDIRMEDYETILEDSRSEVEENRQILSSYSTKLQELDKNITTSMERIRDLPQQLSEMNSDVRVAYQDMQTEVSKIEETIFVMEDLTRQSDQLVKLEDELKYNMDLLRDYIRQARDAANLVTLGVNFTHESVLQVRNSIDMPSSGMVSKISLHFQTKQADGLLFYIGKDSGLADDYMIGEIVGGYPQFRINLGSVETVVKGTKPVNNNQITTYEIRREGKDLKLFIDSNPIDGEVGGDSFTFQYDNSTKFYVGGVPDHILKQNSNLSSILPRNKFVGVIENLVYDERMVGLWNFVDASGLRGAHFKKIKIFSEDNIFTYGGTGYAHMKIENQLIEENLDVSFDFKTYSKDALLFHQGTDTQFITLDLVDGKLRGVMDMGSGGLPRISESAYNNGLWHSVSFSRRNRVAVLRIDSYTVPRMAVNGWKMIYEGESDFFIGGLKNPDNYTKPTKSRFKGCIRNFQAKSAPYPIQSAIEFVDVQYGCRQSIRVVSFPPSPIATGYIKLFKDSFSLSNDFAMSFKFRSQQSDALIFYIFGDSQNIGLSLSLVDGYLKLVFKDDDENASEELTSPFKFNDGAWHYVNVKRTKNQLSLETEDKWTGTRAFTSRARIPGQQHVYLGGVPDSVSVTLKNVGSNKPFVGCIGDISINSKLQNFDEVQNADLINVDIGTCQYMDYLPPQGPSSFYSTSTVDPGVIEPELKGCTRPAYPLSTWKERGCEGSSASGYYFEYSDGPTSISKFVLTLNLKTSSPDGVIFYAYNQQHSDFIALFMKGGAMHGFVNCGGGITKTALQGVNFADDAWHNVYFRYEDGLVTLNVGRHSNNTALMGSQTSVEVTASIFMAGLPQQVFQSSIVNFADKKPDTWMFNGELKDITLQGKPIESKLIARSSSPGAKCPAEQGIFFFPVSTPFKTYGSVYKDYSAPTHMNISFMIKPRLLDGILFSVHNPANDEFIILQLVKGEFHLIVNNGLGNVIQSDFKPSNKMFWCERKWYSVSANKVKNVVYVIVDGLRGTSGVGIEGISSTDTSHELFIGGAKEMHSGMLVSNSFVGCMKDLYVEGKPVPLRDLQFKGDVLQDGCPVD